MLHSNSMTQAPGNLTRISLILNNFSFLDPRVNDWPLMDSPVPTLLMVVTYLYVVTILGPQLMANRKPFQLNQVLIVYNAFQVAFSLLMLWEVRIVSIFILQRFPRLINTNHF